MKTALVEEVYAACQKPWGGATIDCKTWQMVHPKHGYAVKSLPIPTIILHSNLSLRYFRIILETLWTMNGRQTNYLGVFHDADTKTMHFDVVDIVATADEVDAIAEISGAQSAYHFPTGLGYFPGRDSNERNR